MRALFLITRRPKGEMKKLCQNTSFDCIFKGLSLILISILSCAFRVITRGSFFCAAQLHFFSHCKVLVNKNKNGTAFPGLWEKDEQETPSANSSTLLARSRKAVSAKRGCKIGEITRVSGIDKYWRRRQSKAERKAWGVPMVRCVQVFFAALRCPFSGTWCYPV